MTEHINDIPAYLLDIDNFQALKELPVKLNVGKLVLMKHIPTGRIVTARFLNDGFADIHIQRLFFREIWIQIRLRHPCIQRFRGFTLLRDDRPYTPALIHDYSNYGTLQDYIDGTIKLTPTQKTKIAFAIAYGMQYVHSLNVLHRNLKPTKILFNKQLEPLISDFFLSLVIPENPNKTEDQENEIIVEESAGTKEWKSPEMASRLDDKYHLTLKSDVFQYGQIIGCLLSGKDVEVYPNDVDKWDLTYDQIYQSYESTEKMIEMLYVFCLSPDLASRPSFSKIVNDMFLSDDDSNIPVFDGTNLEEFKEYRQRLINS
ncbi:hypothetical protein M9Y10_032175 [Tritrichomonas musculus]|uniref:Protein kinase domain-containing protein n=1 Tax=Tritrichomonas musculus TaxID=1915356 RepID=A0ABR2GZC6_9EUKA